MEIEKLIDELRIAGAGNPGNIFDEAANVLERLNNFNESQCAMLLKKNAYLHTELEQIKRERDAAIEDLSGQCEYCLNEKDCVTRKGPHWNCWEWRGVQKEER